MNICTISGNLGRDAETRHTPSGKSVTSFSIANSIGWGQNKKDQWVRCTLWGERGEKLAQYLTKGKKVTVSGEVSLNDWEKDGVTKSNLEINVREVDLPARDNSQPQQQSRPAPTGTPGFDDTDIPF